MPKINLTKLNSYSGRNNIVGKYLRMACIQNLIFEILIKPSFLGTNLYGSIKKKKHRSFNVWTEGSYWINHENSFLLLRYLAMEPLSTCRDHIQIDRNLPDISCKNKKVLLTLIRNSFIQEKGESLIHIKP